MDSRVVIVGASLAGLRAAESLRRIGHEGPITIVGSEVHQPYDRPPLSKQLLLGKVDADGVALDQDERLDAEWRLGLSATRLDLARRRVGLSDGDDLPFDHLVIATGASPRILPGFEPGDGVHYLRTLDDSLRLKADLAGAGDLVVIGAGFIGLEVAASASQMGIRVTVVEALAVPLARAIGGSLGGAIAELHRRRGIDVRVDASVESVERSSRIEGVRLAGGEVIPASTVVVGVGVSPQTGWLAGSGVDLDDGVMCDARLRVLSGGRPVPGIAAAGDVARWHHPGWGRHARIEHWTNAVEQGEAAARTLLEGESAPAFSPTPYFWSDQHGIKIQFVGETQPGDDITIVDGSVDEERFVAAFGRQGRLVAALGMRRPAKVMALQQLIAAGAGVPETV